jgi:putative sporulation protein YtaF
VKLFDLNVVLTVYADAGRADLDHSKSISVREAVYLALALSLDGFAAGFGWGLLPMDYLGLIALSLLSNVLALTLGYFLGKWLIHKTKLDLSWLGGVILIALGLTKLFRL